MLALVFAKLCRKFMIAHALLDVFDLLITRHSETLGQPGPREFQIRNLPFFLFKIHGLYSLGVTRAVPSVLRDELIEIRLCFLVFAVG